MKEWLRAFSKSLLDVAMHCVTCGLTTLFPLMGLTRRNHTHERV
jgi:hypothetical protein